MRTVVRKGEAQWGDIVANAVAQITSHHGECGLELGPRSDFVRRELCVADHFVALDNPHGTPIALAFLKTPTRSSSVYILLMASFEAGGGRALMQSLHDSDAYRGRRYIILRATDRALGFYLHLGFALFNWSQRDGYLSMGDLSTTRRLQVATHSERLRIREELRLRHWMGSEQEEWPLLLRLPHSEATGRRSARIIQADRSCSLRRRSGRSV